jgi:hypothetical protein
MTDPVLPANLPDDITVASLTVDVDQAPAGPPGPQGPPGVGTVIVGSADTVGELPDPTSIRAGDAYMVAEDGGLYIATEDGWLHAGRIVGQNGGPVPVGGSAFQVLTKQSAATGDAVWAVLGERPGGANQAVAIGSVTAAGGQMSVVIGSGANAGATTITQTVVIGRLAAVTGQNAVAIGWSASAAANATALGSGAKATHARAVAVGNAAETTAVDQVMLGGAAHTVTSPGTLDFTRFSPAMIAALRTALGLS